MLRAIVTSLALATLCLTVAASAADLPTRKAVPDGNGHTIPGLAVDGEAEDTVNPDIAILSLEAVVEAPTAAAASQQNSTLTKDLIASLAPLGINPSDVRTESLELTPLFRERAVAAGSESVERVLAGYRASTMARARIRDVDQAPRIARTLIENGSDSYRGLTFLVSDHEARFEALRTKAIADAANRAKIYAESAQTKLCQVLEVTAGAGSISGLSERNLPVRRGDSSQAAISAPTAVEPQPLRAHVVMTWALPPDRPDSCEAEK